MNAPIAPSPLLAHALELARGGFRVFPCDSDRKKPCIIGWQDSATTDPARLSAWWSQWPSANVGIVVPEGCAVVDVDPRNGGSLETLAMLGELPRTLTTRTGGGGWHLWFQLPAEMRLPGKLGPGIDVKNPRSLVLGPGSLHRSGSRYEWADTSPIAPAPSWLLAKARPAGTLSADDVARMLDEDERKIDDATIDALAAVLAPHFVQGQKHTIAKLAGGWLKQRGWAPADVRAVVEQLPAADVEAKIQAALAAFDIAKDFGWTELSAIVGVEASRQLDAFPNPKRVEDQAWSGLVAGAVPSAAPLPAAPLSTDPFPWIDADTLFKPLPPVAYVVPRLCICPGAVTLVAGYGSAGKTMAAQQLAIDVMLGRPAWGAFPVLRSGRVAHLDYEQGYLTLERYQRFIRASGAQADVLRDRIAISLMPPMYLDGSHAEAALVAKLHGFTLAIVDSFRACAPSTDENSSEVRRVLDMLGRVSERTGAAIVLIHHARKPSREQGGGVEMSIRGSSGFFDGSGSVLILEGQEGQPTRVRHCRARASGQKEPDFTLTTDDPGGRGVGLLVRAAAAPSVETKRAGELAAFDRVVFDIVRTKPGLPTKGVSAQLEITSGSGFTKVGNALERLKAAGWVVERPGPRNAKQWYASGPAVPVSSPVLHELSGSSPWIAQSSSPPLHPPIGVGGEDRSFGGIE